MKSSGISSAKATSPPPAARSRKTYALTGRSAVIDPERDAARADLADVRLADRVFAPHYAAALQVRVIAPSELRAGAAPDAAVRGSVAAGEVFELLERSRHWAWGIAASGLVGYIDATALGETIA